MEFDEFTVAVLILRPDAPLLDEDAEAALQDAHLAHLAELHDSGALLAAGPLPGPPERTFRGLNIFKGGSRRGPRARGPGSGGARRTVPGRDPPVAGPGRRNVLRRHALSAFGGGSSRLTRGRRLRR